MCQSRRNFLHLVVSFTNYQYCKKKKEKEKKVQLTGFMLINIWPGGISLIL